MGTLLNLSFLLKFPKGGVPFFLKRLVNVKEQRYLELLIVIITLKGYSGIGV